MGVRHGTYGMGFLDVLEHVVDGDFGGIAFAVIAPSGKKNYSYT